MERLSGWERERIYEGLVARLSLREIARRLGRAPSTVSREVRRNATNAVSVRRWGAQDHVPYSAFEAELWARERRRRPRPARLSRPTPLRAAVVAGLAKDWSPQQVSADLRRRFPDDRSMQASHEAIYRAVYLQGRGTLREELKDQKLLRTGRVRRRRQGRAVPVKKPWLDLHISQRPPEVADRAVPGHWEGDLVLGAHGKSAVATLVERQTRYVLLTALPDGKVSEHVVAQLVEAMRGLPGHLRRSLTWDQGGELAQHATFTLATGCQVYFCDPHSPWQRGSNENTNGLLRQYLPRGLDLSTVDQQRLDDIAHRLNTRPRQTLDWDTPAQRLNQLLLR